MAKHGAQMHVDVSVIVPTRNEAGDVAPLVAGLHAALGEYRAEIVFVDDSDDSTPQMVAGVAAESARPIRLIHRRPGERAGGLGSAVLQGLRAAAGDWAVVMDGDLQHPPDEVPALIARGRRERADVVVASRHVGSGSSAGLNSALRQAVSNGATALSKAVFPVRLRRCTDPMSGFFAVRPDRLDLDRLRPKGFKILLEILTRSRGLRICEHPFTFGVRHSGDSKANWREGALFIRLLIGLRLATLLGGRLATILAFLTVGLTGIAVNNGALWFFAHILNARLLLAAILATQVSTTWNFVLSDRLVFRGPKAHRGAVRYLGFAGINNAALLARLPVLYLLVHHTALGDLAANTVTLALVFVVRFAVSDLVLFVRGDGMTSSTEEKSFSEPADIDSAGQHTPQKRRSGPVDLVIDLQQTRGPDVRFRETTLTWRYDVHGIVRIDSAVRLPELEWFRTSDLAVPDIVIRTGQLAGSRIRGRTRVTQYGLFAGVSYQEQLGRFGSDFHVEMTDNIQVVVGPMLASSPHVLYTNVVEALLRFVLVSRGFMLLHSACLELDGRGVLLSALTDTGKTGTILRLLRENPSRFLSDDMTILDATGVARCYPKPLTISQHTLRAVQAGDLSRKEWRRLRVQSRIHSKQGRGIGARLGELNFPIMTLNAITQRIIPPPKYEVDRLVPCEHTTTTSAEEMFIIERGEFALSDIDPANLFDELIANTDDAYGFPPFRYFAPALVVGGTAYEELRAEERRILISAMAGVRARRLATPDFTWADHIPRLAADVASGDFWPSDAISETEAW